MSDAFLSSDDFDEQAHHLYNEGRYDEALLILKEGITLYPHAVELHIGMAYAHLAREEYAWARRSFEQALSLDPDHEDGLAGLGETLLKLGDRAGAMRAVRAHPPARLSGRPRADAAGGPRPLPGGARSRRRTGSSIWPPRPIPTRPTRRPAWAMRRTGWATTPARSTGSAARSSSTRRYSEARIYLANLLYDRGETEAALHQLERTQPEDHFDELGIWRHIELKKTIYRLPDEDPELAPWLTRLGEVAGEPDADRHAAGRGRGPAGRRRRARSRTSSSCSARC